MKFIIVTQTFPPRKGGMQSAMEGLAIGLSKYSNVIVFSDHGVTRPIVGNFFSIVIKETSFPKFIRPFIKRIKLLFLRINAADIFICDSWKSVNAIPKRLKNKIVVLAHGQEYLNQETRTQRIKKALSRASVLIANSRYTKDLVSLYSNKCLIEIIPPTYSLLKVSMGSQKNKKKDKKINLLSIARIEERKGLIKILEALVELKHNFKKSIFHWYVVGDGPQLVELKKLSSSLGMNSFVTFCGRVAEDEKISLFKKADLFVMTPYKVKKSIEGFGIVFIEAAMYGIPSITGLDGGVQDAVINNISGWCVDPLDKNALVTALEEAIINEDERKKRGYAANKLFKNRFRGSIVIKQFVDTIHSN